MKTKSLILFVFFVFLLSSCVQPAQQVSTPSITQLLTFAPSRTLTRLPTQTLTPTSTRHFAYETLIAEETATHDARDTVVAQYPGNCSASHSTNSVSPNGNWLASYCYTQKIFLVISRNGSHQWSITNQQILEPYKDINTQAFELSVEGFEPYHWSTDSRYLYFLVWLQPQPSFGGPPVPGFDLNASSDPLYRLDTTNGRWNKITYYTDYFSFSPTDRNLVSISGSNPVCANEQCQVKIAILDLKTGDQTEHTLNNTLVAGYVVWTDDGSRFFLSAARKSLQVPLAFNFTIYSMDVQTKLLTSLQEFLDTFGLIYPIDWSSDNILTIESDKRIIDGEISRQYLDLKTNSLVPPTPTTNP